MDGWVETKKFIPLDNGGFALQRTQDVEPILEANKRYQNEPQKKSELMGYHIASIPLIIIEKWMHEDGVNILGMNKYEADKYLRRKLADPDWRYLKTR